MKQAVLPIHWLQELLVLCGQEQHELREHVTKSVSYIDVDDLTKATESANSLVMDLFRQQFARDEQYASGRVVFGLDSSLNGVISQLSNMVSGMTRVPSIKPGERIVNVRTSTGWQRVDISDVKNGQVFCMFEHDGKPVMFKGTSLMLAVEDAVLSGAEGSQVWSVCAEKYVD